MVKNPRAATRPGGLLPLNLPQPAAIEEDAAGRPTAVLVRGQLRPVIAITDEWRIDDEWWRAEISRQYFALVLPGGAHLTVYRDRMTAAWYTQQYTAPNQARAG